MTYFIRSTLVRKSRSCYVKS